MPTVTPRRPKKRKPSRLTQLARESFAAFEPYLNVWDPGVKHRGEPVHTISRELRQAIDQGLASPAELHKRKYDPYKVQDHLDRKATTYYTSNPRTGRALLYLDIDAHLRFQRPDVPRAVALVERLFPTAFSWASRRGHNLYLKVGYGGQVRELNRLAGRLQAALVRLADREALLVDIEVKGTVTTGRKSGSLAKLPFMTFRPCVSREIGVPSWNFHSLRDFKARPQISLDELRHLVELLELVEPDADDRAHARLRKLFKDAADEKKAAAIKSPAVPPRQVVVPTAVDDMPQAERSKGSNCRRPVRLDAALLASLGDEPDRFKAATRFCQAFARRLRRVPNVSEALDAMHELGVYTGDWDDNEAARRARVAYVLEHYVEPTFDASMCGGGEQIDRLAALAERYVVWAHRKFGRSSVGLDEKGRLRAVDSNDMAVLAAISEFCVVVDQGPKTDGGMPWERVKALWDVLHARGIAARPACPVRWKRVREFLDRHGIVVVVDRRKGPGKSWRYGLGEWFPGAWKKRQVEAGRASSPRACAVEGTRGDPHLAQVASATRGIGSRWLGVGKATEVEDTHTHLLNLYAKPLTLPALRIAPRAPP